jgi:hypothetical protein
MRTPDVIGLTGLMTNDARPDRSPRPGRRPTTLMWPVFLTITAVLAFLALLPWISTLIVVALFGLGGSGSNK